MLELVVIRELLAGEDVGRGKNANACLACGCIVPLLRLAIGCAAAQTHTQVTMLSEARAVDRICWYFLNWPSNS